MAGVGKRNKVEKTTPNGLVSRLGQVHGLKIIKQRVTLIFVLPHFLGSVGNDITTANFLSSSLVFVLPLTKKKKEKKKRPVLLSNSGNCFGKLFFNPRRDDMQGSFVFL